MRTLTDWVLRHRLLVGLAWLVVAATGGALAPTTVDRLSYDFALPGQPAYETNVDIDEEFGGGGTIDPLVVVVRGPGAQQGAVDAAQAVAQAVEGTRTVTAEEPGAQSLTADDGELSVAILYPRSPPAPNRMPPRSRRSSGWSPRREVPAPTPSSPGSCCWPKAVPRATAGSWPRC